MPKCAVRGSHPTVPLFNYLGLGSKFLALFGSAMQEKGHPVA